MFTKLLITYLFAIQTVLAGFPPTTMKGQSESTKTTTFNFEAPHFQATKTGSGTALIETGNGNVLKDPGMEGSVVAWGTYADAAGTQPVDGTGGTANVTVAYSTSSPLEGKSSLIFTKDAANRQGQGANIDFTIPDLNKGKVNRILFGYEIISGTYATGDLTMWVINTTSGRVIPVTPTQIENSALKENKFVDFQSDLDSNAYRLVIHVTSTSALAYSLKLDSFSVGLGSKVYGSVATDWELVTSGASVNWTNATLTLYKRRVGDSVEYQGKVSITGTPVGGALTITVPHSVESLSATYVDYSNPGYWLDSGSVDYAVTVGYTSSNVLNVYYFNAATPLRGYSSITPTAPFTAASGDELKFRVSAKKVQGWSSSQQLSQDADTRVVNFIGIGASVAVTAGVTNIPLSTIKDSHAAWNGTHYVVPVTGDYLIGGSGGATGTSTNVQVYVDNALVRNVGGFSTSLNNAISTTLTNLKAGQLISLRASTSTTISLQFTITRISGPSQIAASETVEATYTQASGQSIANTTTTTVNYSTKVSDSHNAVTTGANWKFTAPVSGTYSVCASASFNANGTGARELYLTHSSLGVFSTAATLPSVASSPNSFACRNVKMLQGEYVYVQVYQNSGGSLALLSSASFNTISVTRVGNY